MTTLGRDAPAMLVHEAYKWIAGIQVWDASPLPD
jgi:hypothetical protein